jgi:hypothetical protein
MNLNLLQERIEKEKVETNPIEKKEKKPAKR